MVAGVTLLAALIAAPGATVMPAIETVALSPPFMNLQDPAPCDERVYFIGGTELDPFKLYSARSLEEPEAIEIDETVPIPGTDSFFGSVQSPDCGLGGVVFLGYGTGGVGGAFLHTSDGQSLLLERGSMLDGLLVGFITILNVDQVTGDLAVRAQLADIGVGGGDGVIFKPAGEDPIVVSDFRTVHPGETVPASVHFRVAPVGGGVAFVAESTFDRQGLYWWTPENGISLIANRDTPVPGWFGNFDSFVFLVGLESGLAFNATISPSTRGLFHVREPGAPIEPWTLPGDVTTDGETTIGLVRSLQGSGKLVIFTADTSPDGDLAAFVRTQTGEIIRLIGVGDETEGHVIQDIENVGASRDAVALRAGVGGSDSAILRADFPEPFQVVEVPTLSQPVLAVLVFLLATLGIWALQSRQRHYSRR